MTIQISKIDDAAAWTALLAKAPRSALQQSAAYGTAIAAVGNGIERLACVEDDTTVALCQVCTRRLPAGIGRLHVGLRGPVWLTAQQDRRARAAQALRAHYRWCRGDIFIAQPEDTDGHAFRQSGAKPVMTGSSTAWLDLRADEAELRRGLDGKWRNTLVKAEKSRLRVETSHGGRFLDALLHADQGQQGRRGFFAAPIPFNRALTGALPRRDVLVLSALDKARHLAGILILRHGPCATYSIGWSDDEGRERGAHNLLLWHGICAVRKAGARWLDLGGIDTEDGAGIARFKLGTGAIPETLAGSFL